MISEKRFWVFMLVFFVVVSAQSVQAQFPVASMRDGLPRVYDGIPRFQQDDDDDSVPQDGRIAFISRRDGNAEIYVMNPDGSDQQRLTENEGEDFVSSWSPDGSQIVFINDADGDWEIYIMDADGSNQRSLTENHAVDWSPVWSPDGTQIAFSSNRDGNNEIYVMDAEGNNVQRLTDSSGDDIDPVWSPDGAQILFSSARDGNPELYLLTLSDGHLQRLTDSRGYDGCPSFSPDGTQIAYMSESQGQFSIHLMNADGSDPQPVLIGDGDGWCPSFSPDGTRLAFYSYRPGPWQRGKSNSIFVVNIADGDLQQLTETDAHSFHPRWWHPPTETPESELAGDNAGTIAFVSDRDGNSEIYHMRSDGAYLQRLTFNDANDLSPAWSPDGRQLAFVSDRNDPNPILCLPHCNYDLYVMDADGSSQRQLTDTPYAESHPDWSPDGNFLTFDADPDGDGNHAIYVIRVSGGDPQPLTDGSADDCWGDWSPDGVHILFGSNRDGSYALYIMDSDGNNQRRLPQSEDIGKVFPDWSPDGTEIVFFSYPARLRRQDIYIMTVDGTNLRQMTDTPAIIDEDAAWVSDGSRILFQSDRDGNFEIYTMDSNSGSVQRLTNHPAGDYWPVWRPTPGGIIGG